MPCHQEKNITSFMLRNLENGLHNNIIIGPNIWSYRNTLSLPTRYAGRDRRETMHTGHTTVIRNSQLTSINLPNRANNHQDHSYSNINRSAKCEKLNLFARWRVSVVRLSKNRIITHCNTPALQLFKKGAPIYNNIRINHEHWRHTVHVGKQHMGIWCWPIYDGFEANRSIMLLESPR